MTMMTPQMLQKFESYPPNAKAALFELRALIIEVAEANNLPLEEALKWDQISYLTKTGSTLRIDWLAKQPEQVRLYFNCKTRLVETFKEVYGEMFEYETNRVIILDLGQDMPLDEIKRIIATALKYHQLKQLPLLGM